MSTSVQVQSRPPFQPPAAEAPPPPPSRTQEAVSRAAADRVKQSADLATAAAKAERAHNRGVGTVVDVTA
jgi:hypothetical protein